MTTDETRRRVPPAWVLELLRSCVGGVVAGLLIGLALVCEGRNLLTKVNRLLQKQES
jgi:NhaP-type Na+/H+ or K+/H+ antiporter